MKRKLLSFISLLASVAPIIITACNNEVKPKNVVVSQKVKATKPKWAKTSVKILDEGAPNDGLYLVQKYYGGHIYDADKMYNNKTKKGTLSAKGYVKIPVTRGYSKNVIQLKKDDSIIMVYDQDDADGIAPTNFTDTISFHDSSVMWSKAIKKINEENNAIISYPGVFGVNYDLAFTKTNEKSGQLAGYIGSQNNHLVAQTDINKAWNNAMAKLKSKVTSESYKAVEDYYNKGTSKAFVPLLMKKGIFTYERITKYAIKITFNGVNPITAAKFSFWKKGTKNHADRDYRGLFSLTEQDFAAYNNSNNSYDFLGKYA